MTRLRDAWLVLIGRRVAMDGGLTARALAQDDAWRDEGIPLVDPPLRIVSRGGGQYLSLASPTPTWSTSRSTGA